MIKSEIKNYEEQNEKSEYPYLGIFDTHEAIVLFSSIGCGVCVYGDNISNIVGEFCDDWIESRFKKFDGEVVLKNVNN